MRLRYRVGLIILSSCCLVPVTGAADAPHVERAAATRPLRISVPAQPIAAAINDFARQSGVHIVMEGGLAEGRRSAAVSGYLETQEALRQLLAGTGLTYKVLDERTIAIVRAELDVSREPPSGPQTQTAEGQIRLAQAPPLEEGGSEVEQNGVAPSWSERPALEEVVVTGTHLRGAEPIGSTVLVVNREQIDSSYGKLQDFIETLPQNFAGISEDFSQSGTSNHTRATEIQLRGLGPGTTLTLIDGHRQAPGGTLSAFTDISSIPTSAIERIEILADGASAIYGSDAIGGVVNVVLRDDLDGGETRVRMGSAGGDAKDVQLSQLFGTRWTRGHVIAGYQYSTRDALERGDRKYTAANGDMRPFGGMDRRRDFRSPTPGNIVSATGAVLYAIPAGQDGTNLTAADLLPGQTNYFDGSELFLLPEQKIHSAFLKAEQSIGDRLEIELGARFTERDSLFLLSGSQTTLSVPSVNPFYVNPLGGTAPVRVEYDFSNDFGGFVEDIGHTRTYGANLGGKFALTERWKLSLSAAYGEESVQLTRTNQRDSAAITAALRDPNPATALNVFGDGSANNPETIARIRLDRSDRTQSSLRSAGLVAEGPLFAMNGGDARLAFGADRHEQRYHLTSTFEIAGETRSERTVSAAFAELALPLLSGAVASAPPSLALSLAGRLDDYDDFGSTFNPKVGLSWYPLAGVKLRGTWGTAFRAPPFYLSNADIRPMNLSVSTLNDPASPNGRSTVLGQFGVVPGLKEERAEVKTAGVDITAFAGLSVALTWFDIAYQDKIQAGAAVPSTILVFEQQFAGTGVIIRNPTQAQIDAICTPELASDCAGGPFAALVDFRLRNISAVNVNGLDLQAHRAFETGFGTFNTRLGGTYTLNHEEAVTDSAPAVDFVDTLGRPLSLRLQGGVGWRFRNWRASTNVSYAGSYDNPATGRRIGSWTTVDLSAGYDFESTSEWSKGLRVLVAATNVLDELPPFVDSAAGFDAANSNNTGRTLSLQLVKEW